MSKRDVLADAVAKALMLGGVLYAAGQLLRARRTIDFTGRVVVITGGSRGLGLILARLLADEGAKLVLLAHDEAELRRAEAEILGRGYQMPPQVLTICCDVTDDQAVKSAIERAAKHFGGIDVLINNAGAIEVGPMEHMTDADFKRLMDLHCWGILTATRAALPHLKRRGGRVVNIASLGGLVTLPHLAPYSVSKFAAVGLSHSLRAELAKDGVLVTTVCPGTMRTGSHINAEFKGQREKEYKLFSLAASLPITSMDARVAASRILEACRHGDATLVMPFYARATQISAALMPNLLAEAMSLLARLMPPAAGPEGNVSRSGWESRDSQGPSSLTVLGDRATNANNELRGHAPLPVPAEVGALSSMNGYSHPSNN